MSELTDGYYAVPDPDDESTMTYWRVKNGARYAWPRDAWYGPPRLLRRDAPEKGTDAYREWMDAFLDRCAAWGKRVGVELRGDPAMARKLFAELTTRCCTCGRSLTDDRSKVLGMGPECRTGVDEGFLAAIVTPQIAAAHAAEITEVGDGRG